MTTHTATFPDGTTATRTSDAVYVAASRRAGIVRWHKSIAAARTAAGRQGEVVTVDGRAERTAACVVCADDPRGVPSVSAITGATTWTPCWGNAHR